MKISSGDLFTLIKSLDTQEKVFFKIFSANRGSTKNALSYLKLFDIIDKLKTYDESLLITQLEKTGFKYHLKKAKSYLIEAIFKSLQEYHSNISVNVELQILIHRAEILIKKRLIDLAKKILLKAEKLALEHDAYDYFSAIYSLKASVLSASLNTKDMEDYLNHDVPNEIKYSKCVTNIAEFRNLAVQVRLISTKYFTVKGNTLTNKVNSILNSPLLASPGKALSFPALQDYYSMHLTCSHLLDKWSQETYQRQKEWLTYLESNKKKLGYRTRSYFGALINLMLIQIKMGKLDEVDKSYEKTKQVYFALSPKKRTKSLTIFFARGVFNYMTTQINKGNPEKALKIWEQIKGHISFHTFHPYALIQAYSNLSQMHFMLENYHDALKWVNKIWDFKEKNVLDWQAMIKIYLLLIHYELENYDMLPYLAKSSKRFLVKHNYFSPFEKIMLHFFEKKIHKISSMQKRTEAFRQLKKEFKMLGNNKNIPTLEYFDYLSWIESKIENRSFAEIIRAKGK